jgi:hypothetical protein
MTEPTNAPTPPATPKPAEAPKPAEPAKAGKPAKGAATPPPPHQLDFLREHASTIGLVLVVIIALTLVIVFQVRKDRDFDSQAWRKLSELRDKSATGAEGFEELAKEYRGSDADPYIRMTWASRLYEIGTKADVQRAKELLEQVLRENPQNEFVRERVAPQIERMGAELADPRAKLIEAPKPGDDAPPQHDDHGDETLELPETDDGHGQ